MVLLIELGCRGLGRAGEAGGGGEEREKSNERGERVQL
jgi:hypothetical protein